jgi:hypothetical protein
LKNTLWCRRRRRPVVTVVSTCPPNPLAKSGLSFRAPAAVGKMCLLGGYRLPHSVQLTFPRVGYVEDFHLQESAPCRAHKSKGGAGWPRSPLFNDSEHAPAGAYFATTLT